MIIGIRVDASIIMGSGHVMRCLVLAEELHGRNATVEFVTRNHLGNLNKQIRGKGFKVHSLLTTSETKIKKSITGYKQWLGVEQETDAYETIEVLVNKKIDWLIIDHYALDHIWEENLRPYVKKIMVIDDMEKRQHNCDILFDQTFGRKKLDYKKLVPNDCKLLLGSENALLRPNFAKVRPLALHRRDRYGSIGNILVSMGSMDEENITTRVLNALSLVKWKTLPNVSVVLTSNSPYLQEINNNLYKYNVPIKVLIDVPNMEELMLKSDLAIGAGGSTSWERCCLALPTILIVLSENQQKIGENLSKAGAAITLQKNDRMEYNIRHSIATLMQNKSIYMKICNSASKICDGNGVKKTVNKILSVNTGDSNDI